MTETASWLAAWWAGLGLAKRNTHRATYKLTHGRGDSMQHHKTEGSGFYGFRHILEHLNSFNSLPVQDEEIMKKLVETRGEWWAVVKGGNSNTPFLMPAHSGVFSHPSQKH